MAMRERKLTAAEELLEQVAARLDAAITRTREDGGALYALEMRAIERTIAGYFMDHPRVIPEYPARTYAALVAMVHVSAISYAKAALTYASVSLAPLHCAMLRLAAARLRKTGEDGAAEWAARLERMAKEEPFLAPEED
jgi:hypothetical protein